MPVYEYVCRECDSVFDARRAMADADAPMVCPDGHAQVTRRLSVFATIGRASSSPGAAPGAPCGSACACHPG